MSQTEIAQYSLVQQKASPRLPEILGLFLLVNILSWVTFHLCDEWIPNQLSPLVAICSHLPMMLMPWLWVHFRLRKTRPEMSIWRSRRGSLRPFLLICSWLIPLQILGSLDVIGNPLPQWFHNGASSILLQVFFQGLFVGLSEELLMRPAIHQALLLKYPRKFQILERWTMSQAFITTAVLFGVLHLGNVLTQPVGYTLYQALYAFIIAIILGVYYERTRNFVGTAFLHNLVDVVGVVVVLVVAAIR